MIPRNGVFAQPWLDGCEDGGQIVDPVHVSVNHIARTHEDIRRLGFHFLENCLQLSIPDHETEMDVRYLRNPHAIDTGRQLRGPYAEPFDSEVCGLEVTVDIYRQGKNQHADHGEWAGQRRQCSTGRDIY